MHPITATHDWIVSHQIAFTLILFAIGLPFSIYASEVKAFLRLPPQKLSAWILKSRINGNMSKLERWKRIKSEPQYALHLLLTPAALFGSVLMLYAIEIYGLLTIPGNITFVKRAEPGLMFCTIAVLLIAAFIVRDLHGALSCPDSIERLELKIANLAVKLS